MNDQQEPEVNEELEQLKSELAEMTEAAKRVMADFQNFKRRTEEERGEIQIFANLQLLQAIFPAIDNLTRAFDSLPEELKGNEWITGVEGIEKNLISALEGLGLETIDELGVDADPHRHEVLMEGEGEKAKVIQIYEKGYAFKGKTVKAARVEVGKG